MKRTSLEADKAWMSPLFGLGFRRVIVFFIWPGIGKENKIHKPLAWIPRRKIILIQLVLRMVPLNKMLGCGKVRTRGKGQAGEVEGT